MAEKEKNFKRINFFRGFLTTEKDWNDAEQYHVEKRKLHNRMFHGPGIVPNFEGSLKVSSRGRGELAIEVAPGYAIDGNGQDLFLWEPEIKTVNPADFKLPQTIYVIIRYIEEFSDFIAYKENLDYKGHRRVTEKCKVEFSIVEPDIRNEVELGRIYLERGAKKITDAKDPHNPKPNEIDLRYVPYAGTVGTTMDQTTLWQIRDLINLNKETYSYLGHNMGVTRALDVLHAFMSLEMFLMLNMIDLRSFFSIYESIFDLQWEMILDVEGNHPDIGTKKEFANFKKNIEIMRGVFMERKVGRETLINIIGYQNKSCESLEGILGQKIHRKRAKPEVKQIAALDQILEGFKVLSKDLGATITLMKQNFILVDHLDLLNKKSEELHKFNIVGARDSYRTRQKLKYPDGTQVEDVGIAYEGGSAEWEVRNIDPSKDLIMITRMDYVHGDLECEMHINNRRVGNMVAAGSDRKFRWRNWPFVIAKEYIDDKTLKIKQIPIIADRDVNMFQIWFYQPE